MKEVCFDPETIDLLREVLDEAWGSMSAVQQSSTTRSDVASRILKRAAGGERDRRTLTAVGLTHVA